MSQYFENGRRRRLMFTNFERIRTYPPIVHLKMNCTLNKTWKIMLLHFSYMGRRFPLFTCSTSLKYSAIFLKWIYSWAVCEQLHSRFTYSRRKRTRHYNWMHRIFHYFIYVSCLEYPIVSYIYTLRLQPPEVPYERESFERPNKKGKSGKLQLSLIFIDIAD